MTRKQKLIEHLKRTRGEVLPLEGFTLEEIKRASTELGTVITVKAWVPKP